MQTPEGTILALDVGARRIGVAEAHSVARIAHPLTTVQHTADIFDDLAALVTRYQAVALVIGLPRGMQGQETDQTRYVKEFAEGLKKHLPMLMYWQDEALTSQKAEDELMDRRKPYTKGDVDALAATYILDDFLQEPSGIPI